MKNSSEGAATATKRKQGQDADANKTDEIQNGEGRSVQDTEASEVAGHAKPDVSDQGYQELLPKLMSYFHDDKEELARALGLQRSTVDRWFNGKSRPNNSTVLRMRRIAQERRIT